MLLLCHLGVLQYPEPVSKFSLELLPVSSVMRSPVVTLELHMKVCGGGGGKGREGRERNGRERKVGKGRKEERKEGRGASNPWDWSGSSG